MNAPPAVLEVTPHVVRFGGTVYQISNICSVSASRYKVTWKDALLMIVPLYVAMSFSVPMRYIVAIPGVVYAIYISTLLSRYYLHFEMNSGSSDLFYAQSRMVFAGIVGAIENAMARQTGQTIVFDSRTGQIININNPGHIGHVGDVGSVFNVGNAAYSQHQAGSYPQGSQDHSSSRHPGQQIATIGNESYHGQRH